MTVNVNTLRNDIVTSIHGRRLGFDKRDQLVGSQGMRLPVVDATSDTTGTNILGYGITHVETSTNDTWLLDAPVVGAFKRILFGSTSTGIHTVMRTDNSFDIVTSANSTSTTIVAQGMGMLTLFGLTSALYNVVDEFKSTNLALNGTT